MAEFITESEAASKFGSKGKANAGLTLGIIGTALAGLGVLGGGGFGVGSTSAASTVCEAADDRYVGKNLFWQQNAELEKELGNIKYDALKHNYELYVALDNKNTAVATKMAQLEASLPLAMQLAKVDAERYADNKAFAIDKQMATNMLVVENQLSHKIDGLMGLPWSSIISGIPKMPQCTIGVDCHNS